MLDQYIKIKPKRYLYQYIKQLKMSNRTLLDIFNITFQRKQILFSNRIKNYKRYTYSYGDIYELSRKTASFISSSYNKKHKYIGLCMDNSEYFIIAMWAILISGNKPILINHTLSKEQINNVIIEQEIDIFISDKQYQYEIKYLDIVSNIDDIKNMSEYTDYEHFEDEIVLLSSGSSGKLKTAKYSGENISYQILNTKEIQKRNNNMFKGYKNRVTQLAILPFYHVFGLLAVYFWFSFFNGSFLFLSLNEISKFNVYIDDYNVTHIFAVPLFFNTIHNKIINYIGVEEKNKLYKYINLSKKCFLFSRKYIFKKIRQRILGNKIKFLISGGSHLKESTLSFFNDIGYTFVNGYGTTENGIVSLNDNKNIKLRNDGSVGKPLGSACIKEENSLLLIKSLSGAYNYNNDYYNTMDHCKIIDGRIKIIGRDSEIVVLNNGENYNLNDIENLFNFIYIKEYTSLFYDERLCLLVRLNNDYLLLEKQKNELRNAYDITSKNNPAISIYVTEDPIFEVNKIKVNKNDIVNKIINGIIRVNIYRNSSDNTTNIDELENIRLIISKVLGVDISNIYSETNLFTELNCSSLDYFEIIERIKNCYNIDIDYINKYSTPNEIYGVVRSMYEKV